MSKPCAVLVVTCAAAPDPSAATMKISGPRPEPSGPTLLPSNAMDAPLGDHDGSSSRLPDVTWLGLLASLDPIVQMPRGSSGWDIARRVPSGDQSGFVPTPLPPTCWRGPNANPAGPRVTGVV